MLSRPQVQNLLRRLAPVPTTVTEFLEPLCMPAAFTLYASVKERARNGLVYAQVYVST